MVTDAEKSVFENENGDLVVTLPGDNRQYVLADVDAATGLWIHSLTERTRKAKARLDAGEDEEAIDADLHLSDEQESDLYTRVLGSAIDDLVEAGARWQHVRMLGQIKYAWVVRGVTGARRAWEARGDEPPEANRQTRRAQSRASGSKTKASGASASTTKRAASTRSTRTRT
jgi:hypothetical protein